MTMDKTNKELTGFVEQTQIIAEEALYHLDKNAMFKITPSMDIGIPYDVDRLAGGFPTGVYLEWECLIPIVPVDTTVNCCTASIFKLSTNIDIDKFIYNLNNINSTWKDSSYILNFNSGNHFISLCHDDLNFYYLVMHSTAKEFTKGYNGLYPIKGNWYYDRIQTFESSGRYFRYLKENDANLFIKTALSINSFNEIRHENIAYDLLHNCSSIKEVSHWHHYGMNTSSSMQIGCYIINKGDSFPIFSKPGYSIDIFRVEFCKRIDQSGRFIVPHGWGKGLQSELNINIDFRNRKLKIGQHSFNLFEGMSLYDIPELKYRDFEQDDGSNGFYKCVHDDLYGSVKKELFQCISLTNTGINIYKKEL